MARTPPGKAAYTVYLPDATMRAVKIAAVTRGVTLLAFFADAVQRALAADGVEVTPPGALPRGDRGGGAAGRRARRAGRARR